MIFVILSLIIIMKDKITTNQCQIIFFTVHCNAISVFTAFKWLLYGLRKRK